MKYEHIVGEVFGKPWAILPEKLKVIAHLVALRASGSRLSEDEIHARLTEASLTAGPRTQQSFGVVAVIPIQGVIMRRANLMSQISGGSSVEKITSQFRQALADSSVKAIVFDVDSPGGSVDGIPELASEIYGARGQKKSIAVANTMAASAAYWLASAAGEVVVVPSGAVGSIGVYTEHNDYSKALEQAGIKATLISAGKYKVDGNDSEPLSDSARADLQAKVDAFYGMFVKDVARGRRASQGDVREGFGEGHMVLAADAVKEGMADRVATMDDVLAKLGAGSSNAARVAAASGSPELRADSGDPLEEKDCVCACEACRADDHANCSNMECADPNCGHAPRAAAMKTESLEATERRRRELEIYRAKFGRP
jgi:signal peptide peptidase SppA